MEDGLVNESVWLFQRGSGAWPRAIVANDLFFLLYLNSYQNV